MTNDGNYFIADGWVDSFLRVSKYMSNTYGDVTPQEREHLRELNLEDGGSVDLNIENWFKMFELPSIEDRKAQQMALFNIKLRKDMHDGGEISAIADSVMPESVMDFAKKLKSSKYKNLAVDKKTKKIYEIVNKSDDVLILENPISRRQKSVSKSDFPTKYKVYF